MKTVFAPLTIVCLVLIAGLWPQPVQAVAAGTGCYMADYECYNGYRDQMGYIRCMDFYGCFALPWMFDK